MGFWLILGRILLFLGFVSLALAWVTTMTGDLFGLDNAYFYNNAFGLLLLAVGLIMNEIIRLEKLS